MIKLKNVSKKFGKTEAVKNLSFELKKGDVTGLLGPNGAGKTTTMRMITSYYFPTKGSINIDGKDTQDNTTLTQSQIGYLPENNPLYLDMIVVDYLTMSAKLQGVANHDIVGAVKKAAKAVQIEDKLFTKIGELSKGYKQRVGIASALVHDPKIIILDEPTEGLDPNQRQEIRKLVKDLSKNKTILISTHVMQEVKAMCNRVIVINNGELVKDGAPDQISGTKRLKLRIEGSKIDSEIAKLVDKKKGESVEIENKRDKIKTVYINTNRELRSEISKLAADKDWTLWEIEVQDSLEELFRELKQ